MRKTNFLKIGAVLFAAAIVSFIYYSCQKEQITTNPNSSPNLLKSLKESSNKAKFKVKGDIINFNSLQSADSMAQVLNNLTLKEFRIWEEINNFKSLRSIYLDCLDEMDCAETEEEFNDVLIKYADILNVTETSVEKNFSWFYSSITNREGIYYVKNNLVKMGQDYRLIIDKEKKNEVSEHLNYDRSIINDEIIYEKYDYIDIDDNKENIDFNNLKSTSSSCLYVGYGYYGPTLVNDDCIHDASPDRKIIFKMQIGRTIQTLAVCDYLYKYFYQIDVTAQKKNIFGKFKDYSTEIWYQNCKLVCVSPIQTNPGFTCYPCGNSIERTCHFFDCNYHEIIVPYKITSSDAPTLSSGKVYIGSGVHNPSPTINEPKFQKVRGETSHRGMGAEYAIISYGYNSGESNMYCDQR